MCVGLYGRRLKQLKKYSYSISLVQELKVPDIPHCLRLCSWFLHLTREGQFIEVLNRFFFFDEAWFHMSGYVNALNYYVWSSKKPTDAYGKASVHPKKIGTEAVILQSYIVGPIFFEHTIFFCEVGPD